MLTPATAWQRLRSGDPEPYEQVPAAVFRCADFFVSTQTVFGPTAPPLIDISTWGLAVDAGVLASVEYAVDALDVPLIVVLGHDECPAMRAALHAWRHAELPSGSMRTTVEHALLSAVQRGIPADSVEAITAANVVDIGLGLMHRSPILTDRVSDHRCAIVCATYSAANGRLDVHASLGSAGKDAETLLESI